MTNGRCYRRLLFWFFARSMGSEFQRALLIVPASQPRPIYNVEAFNFIQPVRFFRFVFGGNESCREFN